MDRQHPEFFKAFGADQWDSRGLLNDSLLRKLITSEGFYFSFLWKRYLKQLQKPHGGYVTSSIWLSIWAHYSELLKEGIFLIGENSRLDF